MINMGFFLSLLLADAPDANLAIATAQVESANDPTATSCPHAHHPERHWHDDVRTASAKHHCYSGLFQTTCTNAAECISQQNPAIGLATWRLERSRWRAACRRMGARGKRQDLCVVAAYAVGGAGARAALGMALPPSARARGALGVRYAHRLLDRARRLDRRRLLSPS